VKKTPVALFCISHLRHGRDRFHGPVGLLAVFTSFDAKFTLCDAVAIGLPDIGVLEAHRSSSARELRRLTIDVADTGIAGTRRLRHCPFRVIISAVEANLTRVHFSDIPHRQSEGRNRASRLQITQTAEPCLGVHVVLEFRSDEIGIQIIVPLAVFGEVSELEAAL